MEIENKSLKRRIIEISYKYHLSHLGSCLEAVDIIKDIYDIKKPNERFILSQGHAGLALYVVLETLAPKPQWGVVDESHNWNAEVLLDKQGIHPDRLEEYTGLINCSTGSLGQGLPIALGMALADRSKNVYCLISDGEMGEGSIYEALKIRWRLNVSNLKVYINRNGYCGYGEADDPTRLAFITGVSDSVVYTDVDYLPFLKGLAGHYYQLTTEDYKLAMKVLKDD